MDVHSDYVLPTVTFLLACVMGCMASPGGVRPTAAPSAGAGSQVSPDPDVPVMLPPQLGTPHRESGDDPELPSDLRRTGLNYSLQAKMCVSKTGTVDSMSISKGSDMALAPHVVNAVKGWRFRPLLANNVAVPFCFFANFEFKGH